MPDMEKIIKELETFNKNRICLPHLIPWDEITDAIVMLKEQEAVEPYIAGRGKSFESAETWWYECGNCNKPIDPNDKYCRHCGRSVKWE